MNAFSLPPTALAEMVQNACELEVRAFKPGNVSVASPGHGMSAELFFLSAQAIAPPITRPGAAVGERILAAVAATKSVAACNTNLGIVLLLAPLVHAALSQSPQRDLRARVQQTLAALTVADAENAYAAIRLAAPGGLGSSEAHDVGEAPRVTLLAAMQSASDRDTIARQYATGFADVFTFGVPLAARASRRFAAEEWATVAVFLGWLSRIPDTHIARKHGTRVADAVRRQAAQHEAEFTATDPEAATTRLRVFDTELKARGINPGTSADLTVATLVALRLQAALDQDVHDRPARTADGLHPPRVLAREFFQPS